MIALLFALTLLQPAPALFENDYVVVHKNEAPCADAAQKCGDRIIVALGNIEFQGKPMKRGDISVFKASQSYSAPKGTNYLEVAIKPVHPPVKGPPIPIPPEKNSMLYDGDHFFIFEEKLDPGDTRARHGHGQRLVVVVNATKLHQWPDGKPELIKDEIPDDVHFNEPVAHTLTNLGQVPLRNIVIELKPTQ